MHDLRATMLFHTNHLSFFHCLILRPARALFFVYRSD
jgi:hypothetical protein